MIVSQLTGGLGNQMFQYALGRTLAYRNGGKFGYYFQNPYGVVSPRAFALKIFKLNGVLLSNHEYLIKLNGDKKPIKLIKQLFKLPVQKPYLLVSEKNFKFDNSIFDLKDNIILSGYWQSEKYFVNIKKEILKDFIFKTSELGVRNRMLLKAILYNNSISIHIRRGDYVSDKNTNQFHGVLSPHYYKSAIEIIKKRIKKPMFFFFSDDPQWAKKNLKIDNSVYIDWNTGQDSWKDMALMSHCKHNIIANSSFSWWGAWLNQNDNKTVIGPKRWFQDKSIDTQDLIPKKWRII